MHLITKIALCLLFCCNLGYAQSYVAAVNYNHIAVNDTLELVFTYSSEGDEIEAVSYTHLTLPTNSRV